MNKKPTSTERFTNTVDFYIKYRPSYPHQVIELLEQQCGLNAEKIIADIGSGTGIFTELLLQQGNVVYGIEPNQAMREAGEQFLKKYPRFKSINATAENTTLADHSIDLVTAAQAFHWFEQQAVKKEFLRILKADGQVLLIWNLRDENASIMKAYEKIMNRFGKDYLLVRAENIETENIKKFFHPNVCQVDTFINTQLLDWDSFLGRILSTSYTPKPGEPHYEPMIAAAKQLFDKFNKDGIVQLVYQTKCYYGRLST
jgi:SAM-dependent methyltransferase